MNIINTSNLLTLSADKYDLLGRATVPLIIVMIALASIISILLLAILIKYFLIHKDLNRVYKEYKEYLESKHKEEEDYLTSDSYKKYSDLKDGGGKLW